MADLEAKARVVLAEWRMLKQSFAKLVELDRDRDVSDAESTDSSSPRAQLWAADYNMSLTAFLAYYRSLLEFLCPRKSSRSDHITVGPFLGEEKLYCVGESVKFAEFDQRVVHLSRQRILVAEDERRWDVREMLEQITERWNLFIEELSVTHVERVEWFERLPTDDPESRSEVLHLPDGFTLSGSTSPISTFTYFVDVEEAPDVE
ncbi:MAG: hypothetical protein IH941_01530 [Acidobacteria bacterium]|nr:hypothetical protein [Acidobacteriota bacterium]